MCPGDNAKLTDDDIRKVVDKNCQGVILMCTSFDVWFVPCCDE